MEEDRRERRLVHLRGLPERLQDRPDVRHRRVVDDERPRPAGRRPDPAIAAPRGRQSARRAPARRPWLAAASGAGGGPPAWRGCGGDLRHARFLSRLGRLGSLRAARSRSHRRRARGAARADRRRERRPARRVDRDVGAGARVAARARSRRPAPSEEIDAAGNQWFTLRGALRQALLIGGHMDSVPNGGWLDGCLNVLAGVEVLRRIAEEGDAAGHRAARRLGRRGGCAVRPLALRLVGGGRARCATRTSCGR